MSTTDYNRRDFCTFSVLAKSLVGKLCSILFCFSTPFVYKLDFPFYTDICALVTQFGTYDNESCSWENRILKSAFHFHPVSSPEFQNVWPTWVHYSFRLKFLTNRWDRFNRKKKHCMKEHKRGERTCLRETMWQLGLGKKGLIYLLHFPRRIGK